MFTTVLRNRIFPMQRCKLMAQSFWRQIPSLLLVANLAALTEYSLANDADSEMHTSPKRQLIKVSTAEWQNWANQDGSGFYLDLIRSIYPANQYDVSVDINSFIRSKAQVQQGASDIVIGVFSEKNIDQKLHTPRQPIDEEVFVIVSKKPHSWQQLNDLAQSRIIVPRGYSMADELAMPFTKVGVNDEMQGLKMLSADREFYLLTTLSEINTNVAILGQNIDDYFIRTVATRLLFLGFTKNDKGRQLAEIYDESIQILISNGTVNNLYKKWGLQQQMPVLAPSP